MQHVNKRYNITLNYGLSLLQILVVYMKLSERKWHLRCVVWREKWNKLSRVTFSLRISRTKYYRQTKSAKSQIYRRSQAVIGTTYDGNQVKKTLKTNNKIANKKAKPNRADLRTSRRGGTQTHFRSGGLLDTTDFTDFSEQINHH